MEHGYFIVSLDLELMWGMKDKKTIATYGDNVLGARKAIPQILKIFFGKRNSRYLGHRRFTF